MVAVFPSLTEVAVPSLLRGIFPARPPGYEARWFDPVHGEVRGYPGDPESEAAIAPLRARPRGFLPTAAMYVLRSGLSYAQIRWITHRFRVEGGPWLGYLSATDGVAHFSGRESLRASLRSIAEQVDTARREHEQRTGVLPGAVLCSDHGMAFGRVEHLAASELAGKLAAAGFEAVLAPCGEVGAGVVHVARPGRRERGCGVQSGADDDVDLAPVEPGPQRVERVGPRDRPRLVGHDDRDGFLDLPFRRRERLPVELDRRPGRRRAAGKKRLGRRQLFRHAHPRATLTVLKHHLPHVGQL